MSRIPHYVVYVVTHSRMLHTHLRPQVKNFVRLGWRVDVVCGDNKALRSRVEIDGVNVFYVPMQREIHLWSDILAQVRLLMLLLRLRPTIVNAGTAKGGLIGMIAAWLTRVPVRVYQLHGVRLETITGCRRGLLLCAERVACLCAHKVLCVSSGVKKKATELGFCHPRKLLVLGSGSCSGVEVADYIPTPERVARALEWRKFLRIPVDAPVVGFVGRLTRDKGIVELLEAFSIIAQRLPQTRLILIGPFEEVDPIPEGARERIGASPNICHIAWAEDPSPYLHLMNVLVLPTYREGLPGVLLEAAAAEKPVVATRATGVVDVVVDQVTGLVTPIGDARLLAESTLRLLLDAPLARQMGQSARLRIESKFSRERVLRNLEAFYIESLEKAAISLQGPQTRRVKGCSNKAEAV